MRAGKYTVAAQTIIFSVQLFGVYQGFYLLNVFPIRMVDAVVTGRSGRKRIMIRATIFSDNISCSFLLNHSSTLNQRLLDHFHRIATLQAVVITPVGLCLNHGLLYAP